MNSRICLISGLGGSAGVWADVKELLSDCAVSIPDVPWASTASAWKYDPEITERFCRSQLADCDVLVAHSFAAVSVFNLLTGPNRPPPPAHVVLLSMFYASRAEHFDWSHFDRHRAAFPGVMADGLRAESQGRANPALLDRMAEVVVDAVGPLGWLRFYEAYHATWQGSPRALVNRLTLIHGDADLSADPADSRALHAQVPGSILHIFKGGHFPMVDTPEAVALAIRSALPLPLP
ncbi:hypothetical protein HMPREF1531_00976 [Propionibacterium sp. oral taxon 192 str. F0372]|uniref:alpha/beta fold hydrolase n=1 Tax=Propionibacterium sp. oral taxon 192 TaxID=671222 RepID=UPI000352CCB2|nr:alpha/beta hydrolase [Propionibacterium sp. oral taxon 192]EPH05547.1 hypothetical protein HMPREF1531_00976 [Propionibacterium sp. oral taxon 192 str. F0372]